MFSVPYWLTGCAIDGIEGENNDPFDRVRRAFLDVLNEEEHAVQAHAGHGIALSKVMGDM